MHEYRAERGFSLLETMLAATLLAMVLGGVLGLLTSGQNTFEAQSADNSMRQSARVALDKITREARLAGYDIKNVPQVFTIATATSIQFAADIDDGNDGPPCNNGMETAVNGGAERLSYTVSGTDLLRAVDCWNGSSWISEITSQVLIADLLTGQTVFTYFDEDGVALTSPLSSADRDKIKSIGIQLDLIDTGYAHVVGRTNTTYELASHVEVHNMQ